MKKSVAIIAAALALSACATQAAGPTVELKGHRFDVELATDPASQQRGLMFRDEMAADHGMLFVFGEMAPRAFWMKNTHIPLDILFFDRDYKLVSASLRTPPCRSAGDDCPVYPSSGPAQYVLELNAGVAEKLGAKTGDKLTVSH
ncbi:MAG: DUF192 domain-containing protein [Gammaproteobacteria bacterium]|nr:MAG: DUF192 domain-containing protein [Gammaproteobacteria bacterium]